MHQSKNVLPTYKIANPGAADLRVDACARNRIRASSAFRLVRLGEFSDEELQLLENAGVGGDAYAVLLPATNTQLLPKAVCSGTAASLEALKSPTRLEAVVSEPARDNMLREFLGLVLDGVLEMEFDGSFVSGFEAYSHLKRVPGLVSSTDTDPLTQTALRYAQGLALEDAQQFAQRLYLYNSTPLTPRFERFIADHKGTDYLSRPP